MNISFTPHAKKEHRNLPLHIQERIVLKIEFYVGQRDPLVFAKSMGKGLHRFRVGDYRIIFYIKNDTLNIVDLDRRDRVYK